MDEDFLPFLCLLSSLLEGRWTLSQFPVPEFSIQQEENYSDKKHKCVCAQENPKRFLYQNRGSQIFHLFKDSMQF